MRDTDVLIVEAMLETERVVEYILGSSTIQALESKGYIVQIIEDLNWYPDIKLYKCLIGRTQVDVDYRWSLE